MLHEEFFFMVFLSLHANINTFIFITAVNIFTYFNSSNYYTHSNNSGIISETEPASSMKGLILPMWSQRRGHTPHNTLT